MHNRCTVNRARRRPLHQVKRTAPRETLRQVDGFEGRPALEAGHESRDRLTWACSPYPLNAADASAAPVQQPGQRREPTGGNQLAPGARTA